MLFSLLVLGARAADRIVARDAYVAKQPVRRPAQTDPKPALTAQPSVAPAVSLPTDEVWLAPRTDGLSGEGTLTSPFNASGENFDARMREWSVSQRITNLTIHLLPGTYDTRGAAVWYPLTAWRIRGAGMDATTLRLVNATGREFAVISSYHLADTHQVEVSDLTVDCNYSLSNSNIASAVLLWGNGNIIRRVRAINAHGVFPTYETFVFYIAAGQYVQCEGNLIEECEVSSFKGTYFTAIAMSSGLEAYGGRRNYHGTIRRNRVYDLTSGSGLATGQAYGAGGCVDIVLEDNIAVRCENGFHTDSGATRNLILRGNRFIGCRGRGVSLEGRSLDNVIVENNLIEIDPSSRGAAIYVSDGGGVSRIINVKICNNVIRSTQDRWSPSGGLNLEMSDMESFVVTGNRIDATLRSTISGRGGLFFDNTDFIGRPIVTADGLAGDQINLPRGEMGTLLLSKGSAYVMAEAGADPGGNGTNLIAAYRRAKAMIPHGQPLSSTNRATVFLFPGKYVLSDSALLLDTPYVDLIGLGNTPATRLESDGNTLVQTARDVVIENLTLHCSATVPRAMSANDKAAYAPADNLPGAVLRNCILSGSDQGWSTRLGITYSGTYERCTTGPRSWGSLGTFAGRAMDCRAGDFSFAGGGVFTGSATNCNAGAASFGGGGPGGFHGVARNCVAGHGSFGGSGWLVNCEVSGAINPEVLTTGKLTDCRIGPAPGDFSAILLGTGATLLNCTVLANPDGTGFSLDAPSQVAVRVTHCRLNHGMRNLVNVVAQPGNVDDPNIE